MRPKKEYYILFQTAFPRYDFHFFVKLSPKTDRNVGFQRYDFGFRAGSASILAAHAFLANRKSHWNWPSHADSRMLQIVIFRGRRSIW